MGLQQTWKVVGVGMGTVMAVFVGLMTPRLFAEDGESGVDLLNPAMLARLGDGAQGGAGGGLLRDLTFSGSLDLSYVYNWNHATGAVGPLGGTLGGENPVRVFDRFHNEFTIQNLILNIGKEATEESMVGFGFTPSIGTDGQVTAGGGFDFGLDASPTGSSDFLGNTDIDVLEAYGSIRVPSSVRGIGGALIKAGKFLTSAGAETIDPRDNTMFSRTFLFGNAIPFTHTGVIVEQGIIPGEEGAPDLLKASVGFSNGWDSLRNTTDGHVLLTSATISQGICELTANWFFGSANRNGAASSTWDNNLIDIVANVKNIMDSGLSLSLNFDWAGDENEGAPGGYSDYYGWAGIVRYDFDSPFTAEGDDKFYLAFRGEFVDDADLFLASIDGPGSAGPAEQLWDLTWTLGYMPTDYLLCRLEVRYDKADGNIFEDGSRSQQTTFAFNTVFKF